MFRLGRCRERAGTKTVDVELSPELWSALERSAEEQAALLELIVLHAAMCYAAQQNDYPAAAMTGAASSSLSAA
jgi:hypothetical protein